MKIKNVTAVTKVFHGGQRIVKAILSFDGQPGEEEAAPEKYEVLQIIENGTAITRTVTSASIIYSGDALMLTLSPEDDGCNTYIEGDPWNGISAKLIPAQITVNGIVNSGVINNICDDFVIGSFEGIAYSLYIPRPYDPDKSYPLVQFIHDASVCGKDPRLAVAQGLGAVSFATPAQQEKHPCFILCPQFEGPAIVDDDWNVDHRLEVAKRLLDKIVSEYNIDKNRLYTTGQSMGCMSSMVLNLRYPDLFAASLFCAGQWDENQFRGAGLEHKHFWFINSQGDAKAFPIMNQQLYVLEQEGAKIARRVWDTGLSQEEYYGIAKELIATGANILYTPFRLETVANGWHSHGGEHHTDTWHYAYSIDAIHDWLFAQRL